MFNIIRTNKYSFIYAKIFGIMAKSYLGENLKELIKLNRTTELFDTLFPGEREPMPEHYLTLELQRKITLKNIRSIIYIFDLMKNPHPILLHVLRKYEYQNLRSAIRILVSKDSESPYMWKLGKYSSLNLEAPESFEKNILESSFKWIIPALKENPLYLVENMLDIDYYSKLWSFANSLASKDKKGVIKIVFYEILLQNIIWAFRLRFYFNIQKEKALNLLIHIPFQSDWKQIQKVFDIPRDEPSEWRKWKFSWLVEDQLIPEMEGIDPVKAEEKAMLFYNLKVRKLFHQYPFTLTPLLCFIRLKELEADILQMVVEGFRMQLPNQELLSLVDNV